MQEKVAKKEEAGSEVPSEDDLRAEIYEQFDVNWKEEILILYTLPFLDLFVQTESRYDIDTRSKILAEIALVRAYVREPKFKMLFSATALLATYDFLYPLSPSMYGILLGALVTLNRFLSSLRSPEMIAAELEGTKDEDGMPAHYRAKALSTVNTNVTLVLFVIIVGVQVLVTSSLVQGELLTENVAVGRLHPSVPAFLLVAMPLARLFLPTISDG